MGSGWGTGVLKADSQAGCRSVHFFSHTCVNGHRQIRPSVPLHCLDESQVWLGFWRFSAWFCEAEGQRCSFYCRSAPGYLWGMWGSPLFRYWRAPFLPWYRDYVRVPHVAELIGLCSPGVLAATQYFCIDEQNHAGNISQELRREMALCVASRPLKLLLFTFKDENAAWCCS